MPKIEAVFFDLFFTLIQPRRTPNRNEYEVLGITVEEWEIYSQNIQLYNERALGFVSGEMEIIDRITSIMPYPVTRQQKEKILTFRLERTRNALRAIDDKIITTLKVLRKQGIKLGLISNADSIDCKYWSESPLADLLDDTVFSCDVGCMKPDTVIYELAMERMKVSPEHSLFVGDGEFNELEGAKNAGMIPVFTEYLTKKTETARQKYLTDSCHYIDDFTHLLRLLETD